MISHIQICTSGSALGEVQSRIAVFQHLAGAPHASCSFCLSPLSTSATTISTPKFKGSFSFI